MQSIKWAVSVGMIGGAAILGTGGYYVAQTTGLLIGIPAGIIIGAISGFDFLLPGPSRQPGSKGGRVGPFGSGAQFSAAAILCFVFGFYFFGELSLDCMKDASGLINCQRITTGWLDTKVTNIQTYEKISSFAEGRPGEIMAIPPEGFRFFISGFPEDTLPKLQAYQASPDQNFYAKSSSLKLIPWAMWGLTITLTYLAYMSFRLGLRLFRECRMT